MLITTSSKFGLTLGSYKATKIELTERGISIVAPRDTDEKNNALREALLSIDLFNTFFERFDSQKLPKQEFIQNTLERDFEVPAKDVASCYEIIIENAQELGILDEIKGNTYIRLSKLSTGVSQLQTLLIYVLLY